MRKTLITAVLGIIASACDTRIPPASTTGTTPTDLAGITANLGTLEDGQTALTKRVDATDKNVTDVKTKADTLELLAKGADLQMVALGKNDAERKIALAAFEKKLADDSLATDTRFTDDEQKIADVVAVQANHDARFVRIEGDLGTARVDIGKLQASAGATNTATAAVLTDHGNQLVALGNLANNTFAAAQMLDTGAKSLRVDVDKNGLADKVLTDRVTASESLDSAQEQKLVTLRTDVDNSKLALGNTDGKVSIVEGKVATLETDNNGNKLKIASLADVDLALTGRATANESLDSAQEQKIVSLRKDVNDNVTADGLLQSRVAKTEGDIAKNTGDIANNNGLITGLRTDTDGTKTGLAITNGKVGVLETDNTNNKNKIATLEGTSATLVGDNATNKTKISNLESADITMGNRTLKLEGDVAKNTGDILADKVSIATLRTDVNNNTTADGILQSRVTTNESLDATQGTEITNTKSAVTTADGKAVAADAKATTANSDIATTKSDLLALDGLAKGINAVGKGWLGTANWANLLNIPANILSAPTDIIVANGKITSLETKVGILEIDNGNNKIRIGALETAVGTLGTDMKDVQKKVATLDANDLTRASDIIDITTAATKLQSRVNTLESIPPFTAADAKASVKWVDLAGSVTSTTNWPGNVPYTSVTGAPAPFTAADAKAAVKWSDLAGSVVSTTPWPGVIPYSSVTGNPVDTVALSNKVAMLEAENAATRAQITALQTQIATTQFQVQVASGQACTLDSQCGETGYCNSNNRCAVSLGVGASCTVANQCYSGTCTSGVCAAQSFCFTAPAGATYQFYGPNGALSGSVGVSTGAVVCSNPVGTATSGGPDSSAVIANAASLTQITPWTGGTVTGILQIGVNTWLVTHRQGRK